MSHSYFGGSCVSVDILMDRLLILDLLVVIPTFELTTNFALINLSIRRIRNEG